MLDILVSFALTWLLAGSVIWMWRDPQRVTDGVTRGWVERYARLPPRGVVIAAHAVDILLWPRVALRPRQPQPDPLAQVHGDIPRLDFFSAPAPTRKRPDTGEAKDGGRVIPSDAPAGLDCFVAGAPRNDGEELP